MSVIMIFKKIKLLMAIFIAALALPMNSYSHGISTATAKISARPAGVVELRVQFDFIDLLNHNSHDYSLPVIASLSQKEFGLLYKEVIKLFKNKLKIKNGAATLQPNMRLPTQEQMFSLIKTEFIESKISHTKPYTYSDRRFYQVLNFDVRLSNIKDMAQLSIIFPKELGEVYVTYTQSNNQEVHRGEAWNYRAL